MISFLVRFNDEKYWFSLALLCRRFFIGMAPSLSLIGVNESLPPNSFALLWYFNVS